MTPFEKEIQKSLQIIEENKSIEVQNSFFESLITPSDKYKHLDEVKQREEDEGFFSGQDFGDMQP